eukprot:454765_1
MSLSLQWRLMQRIYRPTILKSSVLKTPNVIAMRFVNLKSAFEGFESVAGSVTKFDNFQKVMKETKDVASNFADNVQDIANNYSNNVDELLTEENKAQLIDTAYAFTPFLPSLARKVIQCFQNDPEIKAEFERLQRKQKYMTHDIDMLKKTNMKMSICLKKNVNDCTQKSNELCNKYANISESNLELQKHKTNMLIEIRSLNEEINEVRQSIQIELSVYLDQRINMKVKNRRMKKRKLRLN